MNWKLSERVFIITKLCVFSFLPAHLQDESKVCIVIAGNKCDLEERRKVDKEQATAQANEWNHPYLECSAKEGTNVTEIFHALLQLKWDLTGGAPPALRRRGCIIL